MSAQTVLDLVARQFDRMAKITQTIYTALDAADEKSFWEMVDATGDQDYENTINGDMLSTLDEDISNMYIGPLFTSWFNYHSSYASSKLGFDNIQEYLKDKRIRIHQLSAKVWEKATGSRPDNEIIFADEVDDTNKLGLLRENGASTLYSALSSDLGDSVLKLKLDNENNNEFHGTPEISLTLRHSLMEEDDIDITVAQTFSTNDVINNSSESLITSGAIIGHSDVSSLDDTIDDSCVITLDTAANRLFFPVGGRALLCYLGSAGSNYYLRRRYVNILSVGDTDSITVDGNWRYLFYDGSENPTGANIAIIPMFNEVTSIQHGLTNSDNIKIVPNNDRIPIFYNDNDAYINYHL